MKTHLIALFWTLASLLIIFAALDFFNLTSWLLYPYSNATGKNKQLTTTLGNTPSTNGG